VAEVVDLASARRFAAGTTRVQTDNADRLIFCSISCHLSFSSRVSVFTGCSQQAALGGVLELLQTPLYVKQSFASE
jgi:hypothetical protein